MWPRWNGRPTLLRSFVALSPPGGTGSVVVSKAPDASRAVSASSRESPALPSPAGTKVMSVPQRWVSAKVARPRGRPPPTHPAPGEALRWSGPNAEPGPALPPGPKRTRAARGRRRPPRKGHSLGPRHSSLTPVPLNVPLQERHPLSQGGMKAGRLNTQRHWKTLEVTRSGVS